MFANRPAKSRAFRLGKGTAPAGAEWLGPSFQCARRDSRRQHPTRLATARSHPRWLEERPDIGRLGHLADNVSHVVALFRLCCCQFSLQRDLRFDGRSERGNGPGAAQPPGPFLCLQTFQAMASAKVCGRSGLSISQSHACAFEERPDIGTPMAANLAGEFRLQV